MKSQSVAEAGHTTSQEPVAVATNGSHTVPAPVIVLPSPTWSQVLAQDVLPIITSSASVT